MNQSKNKLLLWVVAVVVVLVVVAFVFNKEKLNQPNTDTTSSVFTPYESAKLVNKVEVTLKPEIRKFVEERMATTLETIKNFNAETPMPEKIGTYVLLSADQQLLGEYGEAKKTLEEAIVFSGETNLIQLYSTLLVTMGDSEGGLYYIKQALDKNSSIPNYWRTRIDIERTLTADLKSLEPLYLEAIEKTGEDIDMITFYASYLAEIGKKEEAVKYWGKASSIYPENKTIYQKEIDLLNKK